jgi:photoactive yellow protein
MTQVTPLPDFNDPDLAAALERLGDPDMDALPFGVIRLDSAGEVVTFNKAERRLSGFGERKALGLDFFTRIAPCMGSDAFRGRLERARAAGRINIELTHIGDFEDAERELTVRIQSAADGGLWLFLRREG